MTLEGDGIWDLHAILIGDRDTSGEEQTTSWKRDVEKGHFWKSK